MPEQEPLLNDLQARKRDIRILQQTIETITSALDLDEILQRIIGVVAKVTGADACLLYLYEERTQAMVLKASQPDHSELYGAIQLRLGEGLTGWVAEHRQPVVIPQGASQDARFKAFAQLPEDQFQAFLSVPLLAADKLIGTINAQHRLEHTYDQDTVGLIEAIGRLAGGAVDRAHWRNQSQRLQQTLEDRKVIDQAKGLLMQELRMSEAHAFALIQKQSMDRRMSMRQIAEAILVANAVKHARQTL
jgi:uroporphyrinogen-III synthase